MASSPITLDGSGLTLGQKLALAATMFCKPCCQGSGSGGGSSGSDSGSGSGSGSGDGPTCCGCNMAWPVTLTATIAVSCGYTVIATMYASGGPSCLSDPASSNLHYNFFEVSPDTVFFSTAFECDGTPYVSTFGADKYLYQGHLDCVPCGTSGGYKWILTYMLFSAIGGAQNTVEGKTEVTLASCHPLTFNSLTQNVICTVTPTLSSCCGDGTDITCSADAWSRNQGCSGSTVTFNISE